MHFNLNFGGNPTKVPQFFDAIGPVIREHYGDKDVSPSTANKFDTSDYVTGTLSDNGSTKHVVYSNWYETYDTPMQVSSMHLGDANGNSITDVIVDAIECCSFATVSSGNDVYMRYKSTDGQYYYSYGSD